MYSRILLSTSLALSLLCSASNSMAASNTPIAAASSASSPAVKASDANANGTKAATAAKKSAKAPFVPYDKLVDINSASKASLMTLAGVGAPEADKIIAGRPYQTKTRLVSRSIISPELYHAIKDKVIAKQADGETAKTTATTPKKK